MGNSRKTHTLEERRIIAETSVALIEKLHPSWKRGEEWPTMATKCYAGVAALYPSLREEISCDSWRPMLEAFGFVKPRERKANVEQMPLPSSNGRDRNGPAMVVLKEIHTQQSVALGRMGRIIELLEEISGVMKGAWAPGGQ